MGSTERQGFFNKLIGDIDDMRDEGKLTVGGKSFLTHLLSTYWGVRGIPETLVDIALPVFLFSVMGTSSERGQQLTSLVFTPWAMKPLFALLSDLFPILHYKKRWWMVIVSGMAVFACVMLATSSVEALGGKEANIAFIYFFMIHTSIAMCDTMTQGKYTEICKAKGASVVSFISSSKVLAGVLAAGFGAVLNDTNPRITLAVHIPFFVQAAIVQALNFMGDPRVESACTPDTKVLSKDYKIVILGATLGVMAFAVPFWQDKVQQLIYANVAVVVCLSLTFFALPVSVAKINVYILFCRMATLDFRYPLLQWYTANEGLCSPEFFPNFSNTVYQAVGLVCGNLATLFGVYLFEVYVSHWNARKAFWVTTIFTIIAASFDLSMLTGFNRRLFAPLGFGDIRPFNMGRLDDLLGFLLGTQALKPIATTLDDMPATVLLSKLCPVGVETTVFAILAALQNIGFQVAGLWATQFIKAVGFNIQNKTTEDDDGNVISWEPICDTGEASNFYGPVGMDGITWGVVVGNIILPLLTIPATFVLLPNRNLDENFAGDGEEAGGAVELGAPGQNAMVSVDNPGAALQGNPGLSKHPSFAIDDTSTANRSDRERASMVSLTRLGQGGGGSRFL